MSAGAGNPSNIVEFNQAGLMGGDAPVPRQFPTDAPGPAQQQSARQTSTVSRTQSVSGDNPDESAGDRQSTSDQNTQAQDNAEQARDAGAASAEARTAAGTAAAATTTAAATATVSESVRAVQEGRPSFETHGGARDQSIVGDMSGGISNTFNHVKSGLGEAMDHWQANTNDSEMIIQGATFGVAALVTVGLLPKILSGIGWEGGGLLSGGARVLATAGAALVVGGTLAGMATGKPFSDSLIDTLSDIGSMAGDIAVSTQEFVADMAGGERELDPQNQIDVGGLQGSDEAAANEAAQRAAQDSAAQQQNAGHNGGVRQTVPTFNSGMGPAP